MNKTRVIILFLLAFILTGCKAGSAQMSASSENGNSSETETQTVTYQSSDGWKLEYIPSVFALKENGSTVRLTCTLEKTGADYFEITYVKNKTPREALYEKIADIDDSRITRTEGRFGNLKEDWSFTYLIAPAENSPLREQYTGIEHNNGTLLIYGVYKIETDEQLTEGIVDAMAETISTLTFTSHESQREFSYVPGTYERRYEEEIEGKKETFTNKIILNSDHTGKLSFQDDIPLEWSSYELIVNNDEYRYEYTVEGDSLMVNLDGEWYSFERVQ